MKKMVKAAIAAVLVCFSSSLFAAEPASFLKTTTNGLFEDETVDNLAWGLKDEDVKGMVLGSFDAGAKYQFSLGAGAFLGDLWWSVYDTGDFSASINKQQNVTNDAVAGDGVNTDYIDVTSNTYKTRSAANAINNELYVSFANDDWGLQSYWKVSDTTGTGNFGKQVQTDEAHDTAYATNTTTKINRYQAHNILGANFKGISTSDIGDLDLYFQLNQFEVDWFANLYSKKVDYEAKQNGVAIFYDGTTDKNSNTKENINRFGPKVSGEMGLTLPDLGGLSTKFILGESFWCQFGFRDYKTVTTNINENMGQKVTTVTTSTYKYKEAADRFQWKNILTPVFVFDFDAGERLRVKASAGATVTMNNTPGKKYNTRTTVTETTTYNKENKTTTKNYTKNVYVEGSLTPATVTQVTDVITTTAEINTKLALVYQVKPEKFNLNLGVKWNPTTLTWVTTKKTNQTFVTSQYAESTNAAGGKTVTTNQTDYFRMDGTSADDATQESKSTAFTLAGAGDTELSIGATWFMNNKVTMDIAYDAAFNTTTGISLFGILTPGLLTSTLKLMFTVKF